MFTLTTISRALATLVVLTATITGTAAAGTIVLAWNPSPDPAVTGYRVHVGTRSGQYTQVFDAGNTETFNFDIAVPGQVYYFVVTAQSSSRDSTPSNEVSGSTNAAPTLRNPGAQLSTVGQTVSLQLVGADPNNDPLFYGASGLPPGLSATSSGLIKGTPTTAGTYPVDASVSDSRLSATASFTWQVAGAIANAAPSLSPVSDQSTTLRSSVSLQLRASDPNGDRLSYSAVNLPPGLVISATTGTITGTPTTIGRYAVKVTVSDGSLLATRSFTWQIKNSRK